MGTFQVSVFINRSQQDLFEFTTNPANDHLWLKDIVSSEWISPEPFGAGSTKQIVSRAMGRQTVVPVEFTIWEPPDRYGVTFKIGRFVAQSTTSFVPQENGTRVDFEASIDGRGLLRVLAGLLTRLAKASDTGNLETLKRIMEAE